METNNNNNEEAKSKIEKIRIDLEKKLAALEAAKMNSEKLKVSGNEILKKTNATTEEKTSLDLQVNKENTSDVNENQNFIEQISNIENTVKNITPKEIETQKSGDNYDSNKLFEEESAFFEINDEIKNVGENKNTINEIKKESVVEKDEPIVPVVSVQSTQSKPIQEKPVIVEEIKEQSKTVVKTGAVLAGAATTVKKDPVKKENVELEEEPKKKSNLNVIIYALGGVIVIALVYFSWSFLGNNSDSGNKNDRILSEYENRRYKDSIELADANNLLLDYESQHYIDSIALANQISIESNPNSRNIRNVALQNNDINTNINPTNINPTNVITELNNSTDDTSLNNSVDRNNVIVNDTLTSNSNNELVDNSNTLPNSNEQSSEKNENLDNKEDTEPTITTEKIKTIPKKPETLTTIEKSPVYPGCEKNISEKSKKKCFISKISKFVSNRFNSDLSQDLGLKAGIKRINVSFVIDKSGNVNVLKVRAQHKVLEQEALRVVNSLPKMKAGKKKGKSEPVYYNLPIIFKVEN